MVHREEYQEDSLGQILEWDIHVMNNLKVQISLLPFLALLYLQNAELIFVAFISISLCLIVLSVQVENVDFGGKWNTDEMPFSLELVKKIGGINTFNAIIYPLCCQDHSLSENFMPHV